MTTPSDAERRESRRRSVAASLSVQQAKDIAQYAAANPSISPGVALSLGRAAIPPGTRAAQQAMLADAKVRADKGGFSFGGLVKGGLRGVTKAITEVADVVETGVETVSRGVFGALAAPGEAIQQTFRESAADGIQAGEFLSWLPNAFGNLDETTIGQGIKQVATGESSFREAGGTGFFMEGTAQKAQRALAYKAARTQEGDKALTLGRYLAQSVGFDADDKAYNYLSGLVDASMAIATDPSTWLAAPVSAARKAAKLFDGDASKGFDAAASVKALGLEDLTKAEMDEAGAIVGTRKTVIPDRVVEWLDKGKGAPVLKYLTEEKDIGRMYDATKGMFDPDVYLALAKAEKREDVARILAPLLGTTAQTEKKFGIAADALAAQGMGGVGTAMKASVLRKTDNIRMFGTTPDRVLRRDDPRSIMRTADRFARNAKFDPEVRSLVLAKFAEAAGDDNVESLYDAVTFLMNEGVKKATPYVGEERAMELFKVWREAETGNRGYWFGKLADGNYGQKAFGEEKVLQGMKTRDGATRPTPHLINEFLNSNVPMPDFREIRRAITPYAPVLNNQGIVVPRMMMEKISEGLFKPLALIRPAYVIRVGLDEQLRPAGVGLASMFSHPIQYLNWVLSEDGNMAKMLGHVGIHGGRGARDIEGNVFNENQQMIADAKRVYTDAKLAGDPAEIAAAKQRLKDARATGRTARPATEAASQYQLTMEGGVGNWKNRNASSLKFAQTYREVDAGYSRALGEELHLLHNDATGLSKRVARGDVYDGERVGTATGNDAIKAWWWEGAGRNQRKDLAKNGPRMAWLNKREGSDAYVDSIIERIDDSTGGNATLRDAIRTGSIGGKSLTEGDTLDISAKALAELDRIKVAEEGPAAISGSKRFATPDQDGEGFIGRAVDRLFYEVAARPSNYLARSPVFRQRYYRRAETTMNFATQQAQQEIYDGAVAAGLGTRQLKRLKAKLDNDKSGDLSTKHVDEIAKADAMEFTRDLLYDLSTRNQFFDAARVLFPFGEAFKEAAKAYTRISRESPQAPYRLGLTVQGGRDADPDGDGKSFFAYDPQTKQEVFNITSLVPGVGPLMEQALGTNGFKAPVGGLNLMGTSVLPGVGPVVQIAAGWILPDEPEFNGLQKLISPFGERSIEGGALESFLPAWANKLKTVTSLASPTQQKAYAGAVRDQLVYLVSTGDWRIDSPEEFDRTEREAKKRATYLFLVRGITQSTAPSPPIADMIAYDKTGKTVSQFTVAQRYRELQKDEQEGKLPEGMESATQAFLEEFGDDLALLMVSKASASDGSAPLPPTKAGKEFRQNNPETATTHSRVIGLFLATDDDPNDFDNTEYQRQIKQGERQLVTPETAARQANKRVAQRIYDSYEAKAGRDPKDRTPAEKAALKVLKEKLKADYPGFARAYSDTSGEVVADVLAALSDPVISQMDTGQAAAIYAGYREKAMESAKVRFGADANFATSKRAKPIRDSLRALAGALGDDYPGFTELFERSFEREMVDDD